MTRRKKISVLLSYKREPSEILEYNVIKTTAPSIDIDTTVISNAPAGAALRTPLEEVNQAKCAWS